jgi:YidC/Oxa1 family membrane protein insertase
LAEFSNPNQQGGQDNRSLVAMMAVLMAVFFGLQFYKSRNAPTPAPAATARPAAVEAPVTAVPMASPPASGFAPSTAAPTPATPAAPIVQAPAEAQTVVENELYRITFSNRGAKVTSWVLKLFQDDNGRPLDLVHAQAAQTFGYPLSLYTYDPAMTAGLNNALFVPSATGPLTAPASLTFKFSNGDVVATKTFSFDESYVLHADIAVTKAGVPVRTLLSWPGGFGDQNESPNGYAYNSAQFDDERNGTFDHVEPKKVSGGETLNGPFDFAGVADPFFAAVFLPDSPATATVATLHGQLDVAKTIKRVGIGAGSPAKGPIEVPILGAALGDTSGHTLTRVFVGPKSINVLKSVAATRPGVTLEPMLEFGFWGLIGKYLFLALQFIHSHIASNWGWAIILLTVFINILTLPFKIKTMQSALKMQRIQPQTEAIKAKYKNPKMNSEKFNEMNAEIMALQKREGVNMFGGCIPTLITLPLLWAFFTMLPRVVELRHAHWFWLPDLQQSDPLHILPILMVVSMFLMQYYTPSPGVDPQQQKMMAFMMPAISGYMIWNYGSGLGLYWATGNLISIAQQAIMNRTSLGREMREIAAKRARRKALTIQGKK